MWTGLKKTEREQVQQGLEAAIAIALYFQMDEHVDHFLFPVLVNRKLSVEYVIGCRYVQKIMNSSASN